MTTYINLISNRIFKAIRIHEDGVVFQDIETKEEKLYTNHQISKFIRKN